MTPTRSASSDAAAGDRDARDARVARAPAGPARRVDRPPLGRLLRRQLPDVPTRHRPPSEPARRPARHPRRRPRRHRRRPEPPLAAPQLPPRHRPRRGRRLLTRGTRRPAPHGRVGRRPGERGDSMIAIENGRAPVPRDPKDDYTRRAADTRRAFLSDQTGATFEHVSNYSFDPAELAGNIEQFVGVVQVPLGVAGPLLVNGEHAQGEFYVPLATAEGTLVASYNRGMKLLHAAGGVRTTILDDRMQRAPCFVFASAREARAFGEWLAESFDDIKAAAEATTRSGRLQEIE